MTQNWIETVNNLTQDRTSHRDRNDRVLIIDGLNTFMRVYSVVPILSENGTHQGGVVGFLRSTGMNIRDFQATRCIVVFDGKGGSQRRRKIYPEYKENRRNKINVRREQGLEVTPEEEKENMKRQIIRIFDYLDCLPVHIITVDNIEADDTIAFIARQYYENIDSKIRIVSSDRDFIQLISSKIEVYNPVKKRLYNEQSVIDEYGICAKNYLIYRCLDGDKSDNISGVSGVGQKTIIKEISGIADREITFEEFYNIAEKHVLSTRKPKEFFKKIIENWGTIERNHELMQLYETDISAHSKIYISNIIDGDIPDLKKIKFMRLLIEDFLNQEFKNFDSWIQNTFFPLTVYE